MYQVIPHTADVGLRIEACTLNSLFEDAARGLFSLIIADMSLVKTSTEIEFSVSGEDLEYLFFDWLNELLFTFEHQRMLFTDFKVTVGPEGLKSVARGEKLDPRQHCLEHELKAITYHGLMVAQKGSGWVAEVIVDI